MAIATEKRVATQAAKRSHKRAHRSRSGAATECPRCGKRLRGEKGLKLHMLQVHEELM